MKRLIHIGTCWSRAAVVLVISIAIVSASSFFQRSIPNRAKLFSIQTPYDAIPVTFGTLIVAIAVGGIRLMIECTDAT